MLVATGATAAAAAAVIGYLVVGGSSSPAVHPKALPGHQFLYPECAPVHGTPWRYPGVARIQSSVYESFAIHYSCASAKTWTKRLAQLKIPVLKTGNQTVIEGPPGFKCEAWPDARGHAYAGGCQKGTRIAFGWNWNVANRRVALVPDDSGSFHLMQLGGSDADSVIRPLAKGHYQIEVLNTSGIGVLNGFTWAPPPAWTITAITKSSGANCKLASAKKVVCTGNVSAPKCLCSSSGGRVKVDLAVSVHTPKPGKGAPVTYGFEGAQLRITAMSAVPFLIPGTPQQEKRQHGV
jgi:hypothetical protein